jgi:hypothetical protein
MYTRDVLCTTPGCRKNPGYKIASPWNYGKFHELKCYGLACSDHFGDAFREAHRRHQLHPTSSEEAVGDISIYRWEKGVLDSKLERLGGPDDVRG